MTGPEPNGATGGPVGESWLADVDPKNLVCPVEDAEVYHTEHDEARIEATADEVIEVSHEDLETLARPLFHDEINSGRPGILAVDFDGTLTNGQTAYWAGEREQPDTEVIERVIELYHEGWVVVVWTARPWSEASTVAARLTEWGVKYHGIRCEKGAADHYVDDKATNAHDFRCRRGDFDGSEGSRQ